MQDQAMYGPAVAAQLATLNATVAALHGELYRSLNGLEKATEKGFEGVGTRLDKLEDRAGNVDKVLAAMEERIRVLEASERADQAAARQAAVSTAAENATLSANNTRFTVWQILLGAALGLVAVLGTIFGIVSALQP
jgi:hypothetical protein